MLDVLVVLIEEMDQPTADIIDLIAEKLIFATVRSSPPAVPVCARTFEAVTPSLPFPCCLRCTPPATDAQSKQRRSALYYAYDSVQCINSPVPHAVLRTMQCAMCQDSAAARLARRLVARTKTHLQVTTRALAHARNNAHACTSAAPLLLQRTCKRTVLSGGRGAVHPRPEGWAAAFERPPPEASCAHGSIQPRTLRSNGCGLGWVGLAAERHSE